MTSGKPRKYPLKSAGAAHMIVTFAHTKGGVRKTTSAVGTALAAHRAGLDVELMDTDHQGSASRWAEVAAGRGTPLPFPVTRADARMVARRVTGRHRMDGPADTSLFTVVDTPPGTAEEIQAGIDAADLVIVPTGASLLDLDRVWPTLEATRHKPTVVLLTGVLLNTRLYADTRDLLAEEGVPVFRSPIPQREDMKWWFGTVPDRLYGYDDIFDEIMEIKEELQ
jgi:chromosome partitioning protein